jgi:hypothetical protein
MYFHGYRAIMGLQHSGGQEIYARDPKITKPTHAIFRLSGTSVCGCRMLPFCERTVNVERQDISPVWIRSFPVSKQPKTIGEHLRKQRFNLGMRQSQAAEFLMVTCAFFGLTSCNKMDAWQIAV